MRGAFEDGHGADLTGRAVLGDNQADVLIAVVDDLGDAVMQEADADDALARTHVLGRAGAGLGINFDVLVEVYEILDAFIVALELDHQVGDQLRRTGGLVVGKPDQAFIFRLEQIIPGLRRIQPEAGQLVGVHHEAQKARVDPIPVAVGVFIHVLRQVGSVNGLIGLQQALGSGIVIGVVRAAEPDVGRGLAILFFDLGRHFAGGQALEARLDAIELLEVLAGSGQIGLLAGAVNHELTFFPGRGDQIVETCVVGIGGGGQGEDHDGSQQNG